VGERVKGGGRKGSKKDVNEKEGCLVLGVYLHEDIGRDGGERLKMAELAK